MTTEATRSTGTTGTTGTIPLHREKMFGILDTPIGLPDTEESQGRAAVSPGSPGSPGSRVHTLREPPDPAQHRPARKTPEQWVHELLRALGSKQIGKKWQCPAHGLVGEHSPSLTTSAVSDADDGRVLLYCHAGCTWQDILRALHLPATMLRVAPPTPPEKHARAYLPGVAFPPPKATEGGSPEQRGFRFESEHAYGDDVWLVRLRSKSGAKEVTWESRNPHGERVPGLLGRRTKDLPLYCEREIRMAMATEEPVLLVESESSADALRKAGWYATTWAGGAGSPPLQQLKRVLSVENADGVVDTYPHLVVIPDYDAPGIECLHKLNDAGLLVHLLHGEAGEDAKDLLLRVGPDAFRALMNEELA